MQFSIITAAVLVSQALAGISLMNQYDRTMASYAPQAVEAAEVAARGTPELLNGVRSAEAGGVRAVNPATEGLVTMERPSSAPILIDQSGVAHLPAGQQAIPPPSVVQDVRHVQFAPTLPRSNSAPAVLSAPVPAPAAQGAVEPLAAAETEQLRLIDPNGEQAAAAKGGFWGRTKPTTPLTPEQIQAKAERNANIKAGLIGGGVGGLLGAAMFGDGSSDSVNVVQPAGSIPPGTSPAF